MTEHRLHTRAGRPLNAGIRGSGLRGVRGGGPVAAGAGARRRRARPGVPPGVRGHHGRRGRSQHRPAHPGQQRCGHRRRRRRRERDPGGGPRRGITDRRRGRRRAETAGRAELRGDPRCRRTPGRRARARAGADRRPGRRLRLRDRGQPGGREPGAHPRPARGTVVLVGMPAAGATAPIPVGDFAGNGLRLLGSNMGSTRLGVDVPAWWRATGRAASGWTSSSRPATRSSGSTRRSSRWRGARRSGTSSCSPRPRRREARVGRRRPPDVHPARVLLGGGGGGSKDRGVAGRSWRWHSSSSRCSGEALAGGRPPAIPGWSAARAGYSPSAPRFPPTSGRSLADPERHLLVGVSHRCVVRGGARRAPLRRQPDAARTPGGPTRGSPARAACRCRTGCASTCRASTGSPAAAARGPPRGSGCGADRRRSRRRDSAPPRA